MKTSNALAGKEIEHASLIYWARKLIARHTRGEVVAKHALKQARELLEHCKK